MVVFIAIKYNDKKKWWFYFLLVDFSAKQTDDQLKCIVKLLKAEL